MNGYLGSALNIMHQNVTVELYFDYRNEIQDIMLFKSLKSMRCVIFVLYFSKCMLSAQSLVFQDMVQNSTLLPGQRYVDFSYQFINKGQKVVKISKVELTCGCSSHELDKQTIAPGESGVINIKVDTMGKVGRWEIGGSSRFCVGKG